MDIRDVVTLSTGGSLAKSDSLLLSDQNKLPNEDSGVVNASSSDSPRKRWIPSSMRHSMGQPANKVLNPTPLSQFNPYEKSATVVTVKAPVVVQEKEKVSVVQEKALSVVQEKASDVITDKASEKAPDVVKDKASDVVSNKANEKAPDVVKDKATGVVTYKSKGKVPGVSKDKEIVPDVVNEKDKPSKGDLTKDKPQDNVIEPAVVNKKRKGDLTKDKPQDKVKVKVKDKPQDKVKDKPQDNPQDKPKDKPKDKPSKVVLTKDKPKGKPAPKSVSQVKTKAATLSSKDNPQVETNTKASETKSVKALSEAHILRLNKPVQEEVKPKQKRVLSKVDQSKKKPKVKLQKDADEFQDTEVDCKKKNLKSKVVLKRKRDNSGSDSSDSASPEEFIRKEKKNLKLLELHEKYVQIFKKRIPLNNGNGDLSVVGDGNDGNGDDDDDGGNGDDTDGTNGDDDDDGSNGDGEDVEGNGDDDDDGNDDQDPYGSDAGAKFSRVSLEDFGNESLNDSNAEKRDDSTVVNPSEEKEDDAIPEKQVDPSDKETCEEYEITSTPESLTQLLDRNKDMVDELNSLNKGLEGTNVVNPGPITPEKMATRASNVSHSPEKRLVKPSSYLLSPYMNKKPKVVPKITRLEFILGNSLFAMQGDKM